MLLLLLFVCHEMFIIKLIKLWNYVLHAREL